MSADIVVTTTVDLSADIQRRLTDAERKPLRKLQTEALSYITSKWKGWKYANRPASAPRNVSLAKWKGKVESTEPSAVALKITNEARSWDTGEPYVAQVSRRRGGKSEATILIGDIVNDLWPATVAQMRAEVVNALNKPGKPKKLRQNTGNTASVTAAPIIL